MKTKICKNCQKEFIINHNNRQNIFCGKPCAAFYNNTHRPPVTEEQKRKTSESLRKVFRENPERIARGKIHSVNVGKGTKTNKKIKSILELSPRTIPKLIKRLDIGCSICGWKEGTCDIHHIHGRKIPNSDNHKNLTILCPNHHRLAHNKKLVEFKSLEEILPDNWQDSYYG